LLFIWTFAVRIRSRSAAASWKLSEVVPPPTFEAMPPLPRSTRPSTGGIGAMPGPPDCEVPTAAQPPRTTATRIRTARDALLLPNMWLTCFLSR